ncbi:MAG: hypothetical protein K2G20_02275 [Lachnospiraceae bacterium]|nr:hypothetical protein [Lachnospiraceae bacterium]
MKRQKFLACLLAGAMVLSMAACGDKPVDDTPDTSSAAPTTEDSTPAPEDTTPVDEAASIDFEDGNMAFVAAYTQPADAAEVELSIVDFNGSKALQVKNLNGKVPYIAFDATTLLGADVAKVATIELTLGTSFDNGGFSAVSGKLIAWSGEDLNETTDDWSVYMATKNPAKVVATLAAGEEFIADAGNIFMLNLKTDNGVDEGNGNATLYIDNVRFLDASGNLLTADTSVAFVGPEKFAGSGVDVSNLMTVNGAVNFEGFATSEGGWAQAGFTMPQEIIDALVPGSVVEIEFTSENGDMWIVMNEAEVGWSRVGDGGGAYINNSKTVAQITYEQIAAICGDDVSTWGSMMQCEASGAWEVFSVKVGKAAPVYTMTDAVEFSGAACSGGAWAQNGAAMTEEILAALVPGSVVEINYTSESGNMWIVMNEAAVGWSRVADGGNSSCYGGKCYVTYEQIAAVCGDDISAWGSTMQFESDSEWEVYAVNVGTAREVKPVNHIVEFEGFACSGDAWAQAGFVMPQEILDVLVPGAVVNISYTSESGNMWVVMNEAAVGWSRVADGGQSACLNGVCQVTYEQIAAICGDDISTWGTMMQCESDSAWEVFAVSVGQSPVE